MRYTGVSFIYEVLTGYMNSCLIPKKAELSQNTCRLLPLFALIKEANQSIEVKTYFFSVRIFLYVYNNALLEIISCIVTLLTILCHLKSLRVL